MSVTAGFEPAPTPEGLMGMRLHPYPFLHNEKQAGLYLIGDQKRPCCDPPDGLVTAACCGECDDVGPG